MNLTSDWQINKEKLLDRSRYLLETGKWADCRFVVGQVSHQQILKGHKLLLAMSSPVFEAMFFGNLAEKNDLIPIRDVQPEAFKALLEYIYTDGVDLSSFELACELCYCAKKYMLPALVKECTRYLWSDVSPEKACRAYEFAKLFEEPVLMEKCLQIICTKTAQVLEEPSWEEVELGTLLTVLDQEELQINSEIDLFMAVERWAKAECTRKSLDPSDGKSLKSVIGNALSKIRFLNLSHKEFAEGLGASLLLTQDEAFAILMNIICTSNSKTPMPKEFSTNTQRRAKLLTPSAKFRQCGPHCPSLLPLNYEQSTVNINECSGTSGNVSNENDIEMQNEVINDIMTYIMGKYLCQGPIYYCLRSIHLVSECLNTDELDSSLTFSVDRNIYVLGIQIPTQIAKTFNNMDHATETGITYAENLYAQLLDSDNTRLTCIHFTMKLNILSLAEVMFDRPIFIQKNKVYRIAVVFNKVGWYPIGHCSKIMYYDSVCFRFNVGVEDDIRDGLIRSIIFTHNKVNAKYL
ncbi:BTB/POZ domain-containing protein 6-B-like isoform X2 [Ceratina calcarata]|uniref:BTB/POZ domain-containing protein 6-B-like isoform X2 n=1 Tax=Ceratina calcarata TaxID=156304 RepID=A0AAJ7SB99_9HYME|nr:BTB/POZ domain-containing protein 6-B-like isoform X2 [Ceratina calcarata]